MFAFPSPPDITNTTSSPFEERRGHEETCVTTGPSSPPEPTLFIGYKADVPALRREAPTTTTTDELLLNRPAASPSGQTPIHEEDEVSRAREARLMLLARRYERVASPEDDARMHILTQRLRRLAPRVTESDTNELSSMFGELEAMSESVSAIRRRYGLP